VSTYIAAYTYVHSVQQARFVHPAGSCLVCCIENVSCVSEGCWVQFNFLSSYNASVYIYACAERLRFSWLQLSYQRPSSADRCEAY